MGMIILKLIIIIRVMYMLLQFTSGATLDEAKSLQAMLKSGYNKFVRPVKNQSSTVKVNITMAVSALQEFDEVLQRFSVVSLFFLSWKDDNMVWNRTLTGIESVMMGYKDVWIPEIILTNPSAKLDSFGKEWQLLRYDSNGLGSWYPGDLVKATCSLDVRYFPFDIQECSIEMYAWGYIVSEVELIATTDVIDISMMAPHGTWEILGTLAKMEAVKNVSRATFTFHLKRRQQYIIINVVIPILFLCILNTLVFLMPVESGERISYSITVMLSIAVFMTIVSDTLPKTSEPASLYSYFLLVNLIMSALITVVSIMNLRIYYKTEAAAIPSWVIALYIGLRRFFCRLCLQTRTSEKDAAIYILPRNSQQVDIIHNPIESEQTNIQKSESATSKRDLSNVIAMKLDDAGRLTWKDISSLVDVCFFLFSITVALTTFIVFLLVARSNTD